MKTGRGKLNGEWKTVELATAAELNPPLPEKLEAAEAVSFVPMSAVSAQTASVTNEQTRSFSEVARGFTPFLRGDVLVAKITPCFENGKIAQANISHHVGFGSTEFHVVRPRSGKLDARYALHFLRQQRIRTVGERRMTGSAGQRRIPENFLSSMEIPLPPLAEQRQIAEVLDRTEELRAKRRAVLTQLDSLTQSIFLDLFGDSATNPNRWERHKLGDLAEKITDGEHQTPKRALQGIKLLSARNIWNGHLDFTEVDYVSFEEHERIKRRCNPEAGDVLISCSGTIGRVAMIRSEEPLSLVRSVALVKPKRSLVEPWFLEYYLRTPFLQTKMRRSANSSSQANLFQGQIRELPMLVPPIALQREFARLVLAVERLKKTQRESLAELDSLFASLQHRAFRGEL